MCFNLLKTKHWGNSPMARETRVQSRSRHTKDSKMVLDATLINTQQYKVIIKGKVERSRERSSGPPTPWCRSYRKESLRVPLDYGRQLYFLQLIQIDLFENYSFKIGMRENHTREN